MASTWITPVSSLIFTLKQTLLQAVAPSTQEDMEHSFFSTGQERLFEMMTLRFIIPCFNLRVIGKQLYLTLIALSCF
jgi:hypothetical protein